MQQQQKKNNPNPQRPVSPRYKGAITQNFLTKKKFILHWGCWLKSMVHANPDRLDRKYRFTAARTGHWACLATEKLCDLPDWKEGPSRWLVRAGASASLRCFCILLSLILPLLLRGRTRVSWAILVLSPSCLPRRQGWEAPKSSKSQPY